MLVKVTQEHIDRAGMGCHQCPAAVAIKDAVECYGVYMVAVCRAYIRIKERTTPIPPRVIDFVNRYDDGQEVEPFEFELPDSVLPAGLSQMS